MADDQRKDDLAAEIVRQNIEHHDLDAPLYDLSHPNLHHLLERRRLRADLDLLEELLGDRHPVRAADVGAGTGRLSLQFVRRGWDVTAVDSSEGMLAIARARHERVGGPGTLELVRATAEEFLDAAEGEFDLFAFSSVLHHLPDPLAVVRMCAGRLSEGGCIYITQEPMPVEGPRRTRTARIVKVLDEIVRAPQQVYRQVYRRARRLPRSRAGELVDYHVERGIDLPALERALADLGVQRRRLATYADRKTALVAYLDDHLFRTPNRYFRYIGQRTGVGGGERDG